MNFKKLPLFRRFSLFFTLSCASYLFVSGLLTSSAHAGEFDTFENQTPPGNSAYHVPSQDPGLRFERGQMACWDAAGQYHGVDPWLLYAVAGVESRHNPRAVNRANRNGTVDVGLMQINSVWYPQLRRYGIDPSVLYDACASTYIGAWILSQNIRRYGYTWEAIAAYNVGSLGTATRRRVGFAYAQRVYAEYNRLTRQYQISQYQSLPHIPSG